MEKENTVPEQERSFGGRKFWDPAMPDHQPETQSQDYRLDEPAGRAEAERRIEKLTAAVDELQQSIPEKEWQNVKAVVVFGSVGRGRVMHRLADVDIYVSFEMTDNELFKKIEECLGDSLPELECQFANLALIPGGRQARFITHQKYPDRPSAWRFIYSRSPQEEAEMSIILTEARDQQQKPQSGFTNEIK